MKVIDLIETMTIQEVIDFVIDYIRSGKFTLGSFCDYLDFDDITLFDPRRKIQKKGFQGNKYNVDSVVLYSTQFGEWIFQLQNIRDVQSLKLLCYFQFNQDPLRGGIYLNCIGYPEEIIPDKACVVGSILKIERWNLDTSKKLVDILFP